MDYQLFLNQSELHDLISLVVDECSRHYYWSTKGNQTNFSYHMNIVNRLERLRDHLKRVAQID